jgi:ssDNA-specific exonuclease RecJ
MFLFAQISIHIFIRYVQLLCHNHPSTMDFTHLRTMPKPLKTKLSILFTSLFYKTFHFDNKLLSLNEDVSKGPKHSLIYQQKKTKLKFKKKFTLSHVIQHTH